jgi:predicted RNase H-like nuclease
VGPAVFLGARRDLWTFSDMAAANRHYWEHEGKGRGVSAQLWNIRDKIRDVDEIMTPGRQATIGEAHPELIFWNLAGQVRLANKTSLEGREQRIALLARGGFTRLPKWLTQRHGTGIGRDDLMDACVCAIAARDSKQRVGGEEIDPRGLRMEINF